MQMLKILKTFQFDQQETDVEGFKINGYFTNCLSY